MNSPARGRRSADQPRHDLGHRPARLQQDGGDLHLRHGRDDPAVLARHARRSALVPAGILQNTAESGVDFVRNQVIMQTMGTDGLRLPAVPHDAVLLHLLQQHHRDHPGRAVPRQRALRRCRSSLALVTWVHLQRRRRREAGTGALPEELADPAGRAEGDPAARRSRSSSSRRSSCGRSRCAVRLFANMLAGHLILVTFATLCAALWALKHHRS